MVDHLEETQVSSNPEVDHLAESNLVENNLVAIINLLEVLVDQADLVVQVDLEVQEVPVDLVVPEDLADLEDLVLVIVVVLLLIS